MDLNIALSLNQDAVQEYVTVLTVDLARVIAQKLAAYVHTETSGGGDRWTSKFIIEIENKKKPAATVAFIPGTTIIPVTRTSVITTEVESNLPDLPVSFLRDKLKESNDLKLHRYLRKMIKIELR